MWANVLVEESITTKNIIHHCSCHPGGENLMNLNASYNTHTKKVRSLDDEGYIDDVTQHIITSWLNSPLHKEVLEYNEESSVNPTMVRHTVIVYMYKDESDYGGVRILVVYQNRHSSEYYAKMGWDEESK